MLITFGLMLVVVLFSSTTAESKRSRGSSPVNESVFAATGQSLRNSDQLAQVSDTQSPTTSDESINSPDETETRVLITEVVISGVEGDLQDIVHNIVQTKPGDSTTREQLQEDVNAIFSTGFFSSAEAIPEDNPLGVRITFLVEPNPILQDVQISGSRVLPHEVIQETFADQYGNILNLNDLQKGSDALMQWYQNNGYVLAQVIDMPSVSSEGVVTLQIAEGIIEDIEIIFLNSEGDDTDQNGNPIEGNTQEFVITRELESQPGTVFNEERIKADLQRVFELGIFDDIILTPSPGTDPRQFLLTIKVIERDAL